MSICRAQWMDDLIGIIMRNDRHRFLSAIRVLEIVVSDRPDWFERCCLGRDLRFWLVDHFRHLFFSHWRSWFGYRFHRLLLSHWRAGLVITSAICFLATGGLVITSGVCFMATAGFSFAITWR